MDEKKMRAKKTEPHKGVQKNQEEVVFKENPLYEGSEREFVNPMFKGDEDMPGFSAPVEKQPTTKLSRKQQKKLEAEQLKEAKALEQRRREETQQLEQLEREEVQRQEEEEFQRDVRAPMQQEIRELCEWAKQYEREHPDWKYSGQVDYKIEEKQYGVLLEARGNVSELSKVPKNRRMEFNKTHPNHIGGSVLSRDATEFLPTNATDEQIRQTIEDLNTMQTDLPKKENDLEAYEVALIAKNAAKTRIASYFKSYYEKVVKMVADTGINMEAPFRCKEEIVSRAMKVSDIFRFVQMGNALNKHMAGLVPPHQRAFVASVYEYTKEITLASTGALSDNPENVARVEKQLENGDLLFSTIHERRLEWMMELDKKAQTGE